MNKNVRRKRISFSIGGCKVQASVQVAKLLRKTQRALCNSHHATGMARYNEKVSDEAGNGPVHDLHFNNSVYEQDLERMGLHYGVRAISAYYSGRRVRAHA